MVSRITLFPRRNGDRLRPGTRLEKYQIIRHIGSGGYGDVYEAVHVKLRRRAAIKVIRREHARDEVVREQFLKEAQILADIKDENIVQVYDYGTSEDGTPWMAMEFLEGQTLQQLLIGEQPFPVMQALKIVQAVAHGLDVAHSQNVIHRDIKPANVFATYGQRYVIVDFGTAKALDEARKKQTHKITGTATYLAPERATSGPVDGRVDIYSLGLVFYELLTGLPAFPWPPNATPADIVAMQIHEWPAKLEDVACWLADPKYRIVREIVRLTIQKKPELRTPSALALYEQCTQALTELRSQASVADSEHWGRIDARAALLLPDTQPLGLSAVSELMSGERTTEPLVPRSVTQPLLAPSATRVVATQAAAEPLRPAAAKRRAPESPAGEPPAVRARDATPQLRRESAIGLLLGTVGGLMLAAGIVLWFDGRTSTASAPETAITAVPSAALAVLVRPAATQIKVPLPTPLSKAPPLSKAEPVGDPTLERRAVTPVPSEPPSVPPDQRTVAQPVPAKSVRQTSQTVSPKCDPLSNDCPLF